MEDDETGKNRRARIPGDRSAPCAGNASRSGRPQGTIGQIASTRPGANVLNGPMTTFLCGERPINYVTVCGRWAMDPVPAGSAARYDQVLRTAIRDSFPDRRRYSAMTTQTWNKPSGWLRPER